MPDSSYDEWLARLQRRAADRGLEWAIGADPAAHRVAYDNGLSPDDELSALAELAEWRGCGCGGGSG
jgi:hypothetical protein